ncbi:hypothetical protein POM88_018339 [Heracleum sosnowskyi]|uniref:Uncharacterized protein n=1 Tax=Heracleum sosnowskyi TaxID=360622 RepID=A0AAD8ISP2_9APIA|nr:hypothetical protein POM88_018339 [Heracleum sosnowskyi]
MPTLVNYRGDDEFYSAGLACSADSALFFSIGSNMDVYDPSRKKARISNPFAFESQMRRRNLPLKIFMMNASDEADVFRTIQVCLKMRESYVFREEVALWEKEIITDPGLLSLVNVNGTGSVFLSLFIAGLLLF